MKYDDISVAAIEKKKARLLTYGRFIKKKRVTKGLSQNCLAEHLGYGTQYVSNWERGESIPPFTVLFELSKILDFSLAEIESVNRKYQSLVAKITSIKLRAVFNSKGKK